MSRFARREGAPGEEREEPDRPGQLDDPHIPEELQRMVRGRGSASGAHPHLVRVRGGFPARLLAALPEALMHVEFTAPSGGSRLPDHAVDLVPWTALEGVRVTGVTLRVAWGGRAVDCELSSQAEALQLARSFVGAAAGVR